MIHVEQLAKRFEQRGRAPGLRFWQRVPRRLVDAVRDVSFTAADGAITALLGPNGAGKTTTLRMIAALITPDAYAPMSSANPNARTNASATGTRPAIEVDGIDVSAEPRRALARMGVLSDARGLYPRLTARENIVYYGELQGLARDVAEVRTAELARLLELQPLLDRPTAGFSQGERMKTALARALVHDPHNIILDEPTNGLDVLATRALRETLRHLRSPAGGGKCILFSTHIMQEVERLCDTVVVMAQGRTVAHGTVDALLERTGEPDFEEAFVALAFGAPPANPAPAERSP